MNQRKNGGKEVIDDIPGKQLKLCGHLHRMSEKGMQLKLWYWIPIQRYKRRRPRRKWIAPGEGIWSDRRRWRLGCEKRHRVPRLAKWI
ncbi:hypothetical protein Trydic_g21671 [Trypoxylus dichotomus]